MISSTGAEYCREVTRRHTHTPHTHTDARTHDTRHTSHTHTSHETSLAVTRPQRQPSAAQRLSALAPSLSLSECCVSLPHVSTVWASAPRTSQPSPQSSRGRARAAGWRVPRVDMTYDTPHTDTRPPSSLSRATGDARESGRSGWRGRERRARECRHRKCPFLRGREVGGCA